MILFLYIRKFHFLIDRKMMKENKKVKCDLCYDNIYHQFEIIVSL